MGSRSGHFRIQFNHLAIHSEPSVPVMVDGPRMLLLRIRPGFEYFQDEAVELVDGPGIDRVSEQNSASATCVQEAPSICFRW